ARKIDNLD
nr:Chain E, LEDGF peptide [Homo sapiens]3AVH_F Chain F, LEDGF peptide [Homo sapiens]